MKKLGAALLALLISVPVYSAPKTKSSYVGRKVKTSRRTIPKEGLEMRKTRRVAIGTTAGGAIGFLGVNLELNLNEKTGFVGGYGGGPGYQSFLIQMKQYIAGDAFLPFLGAGFSRMWNGNEDAQPLGNTTPSFLVEKFLSDEEKRTGNFGKNFLYTTIGAQYVNLEGEYAGFSLFAEVMLMVELSSFEAVPNAGVGVMYYF